jgi:hypothetical protein
MTSSVIDVGYLKNNLNISAYTYQSNQKNTPSFGSAIRYQINQGNWTNKMALSIVSDSRNQSSVLQSLNTSNAMPLADAYFSTAYEKFKGSMELIEALANDNSGKRLQAMGIMGAYTENIFAHQSVFSFTYDRMWHGQSAFNVTDYNASGIYKAQYIAAVKVKFDDEFYVGLSDQLAMGFDNKYNNTMMLSGTLLF